MNSSRKNKLNRFHFLILIYCILLPSFAGCINRNNNYILQNYTVANNEVSWLGITLGKTLLQTSEAILTSESLQGINLIKVDEIYRNFYISNMNICFVIEPGSPSIFARDFDCIYFTEKEGSIIATNINFYNEEFSAEEIFNSIGYPEYIAIFRYQYSLEKRRILIISKENGYLLTGLEKADDTNNEEFELHEEIKYTLHLFAPDDYNSFMLYYLNSILSETQTNLNLFQDWAGFSIYSVTGISS